MPKTNPLPSQELLLELLEYDQNTGLLFWRDRGVHLFSDGAQGAGRNMRWWNSRFAGKEAFIKNHPSGYKTGSIFNTAYLAHRIIWKLVNNEEPAEIDHGNQTKYDNRIVNLRASSHADNSKNRSITPTNTSGFVGVLWGKRAGKWVSKITVNGKRIHLGYFTDKADAITARKEANIKYDFHKNHGKTKTELNKDQDE